MVKRKSGNTKRLENTTLGQRIRAGREWVGLTQAEAAVQLEVSSPAIVSNWENDQSVPEGRTLVIMPGVFGVDGHWLLTGEGEMVLSPPTEAERLVRAARELFGPPPKAPDPKRIR